jgi:hypothetical protein
MGPDRMLRQGRESLPPRSGRVFVGEKLPVDHTNEITMESKAVRMGSKGGIRKYARIHIRRHLGNVANDIVGQKALYSVALYKQCRSGGCGTPIYER